jgi:hypothetical protein
MRRQRAPTMNQSFAVSYKLRINVIAEFVYRTSITTVLQVQSRVLVFVARSAARVELSPW